MEAQLSSASSYPAQDYTESFFAAVPSDSRFLCTSYQKFPPESSIDGKTINFTLSRYEAGNLYLLQDCCLEILCVIQKADGTVPDKTKQVAPNCNVLHTAFEAVRVYINDTCITPCPSYYHLKTYISQTLTYSSIVKASQLESQGYYGDIAGFFTNTNGDINSGFGSRNKLFRKRNKKDGEYKSSPTRFFGKLNLDLISCETGLPPGTKIRLELDKADSSFVLSKAETDTEKYKFKITDCNIYVPVAQLSLPVFNQLSSIFTERSVAIHFRKTEVLEVSLPKNKVEYFSDNLFSFIENDRKLGNYKNPYEFRRYWIVPKESNVTAAINPETIRERFLEEKLAQLERTLELVLERSQTYDTAPTSKGRGKHSSIPVQEDEPSSFLSRLRSSFTANEQSDQASTSSRRSTGRPDASDQPPPYTENENQITRLEDVDDDTKKIIFVKKVDILLNGSPLDQIDVEESEDECVRSFWKMFHNSGFTDGLFTNGISYEAFREGFYFNVFDLSTSSKSGLANVIPTIRVGHLRLRVLFSEALPFDMTCVLVCEYPSSIYINKSGKVTGSFI